MSVYTFYDVKNRCKVECQVVAKTRYPGKKDKPQTTRYALHGKTKDGRDLITFCSQATYDSF